MSILKAIANWRPRTRFYYGWLVLGTAALGTYAATGSAQLVLGGIQNLIFEDLGWDRSTIAFAVTVGTWTAGLITPLFGKLADRYGPRGVMPISLIIVGISFFAFAGVHSVWQFYAAYIVARGLGHPALIGVVPRTLAVNFFQRKRNLALGLSSMARPISAAVNIQIISLIAAAYSWRIAYRFLGVLSLALAIPVFLIVRRRPEDIGLRPDGDTGPLTIEAHRNPSAASGLEDTGRTGDFDWRAGEAALTSAFWLIAVAEALTLLTTGSIGFQVVPYLKGLGLSQPAAAGALSISALLGAFSNPAWGYLSDRFSPRSLMMVALAIAVVVTALLVTVVYGSGIRGFFGVILWGMATGTF
ncbi:MAG: MFS transporter, partial [Chloroflexi bacterium]|nr:MFS transporter [Chloroflexota bacterium]